MSIARGPPPTSSWIVPWATTSPWSTIAATSQVFSTSSSRCEESSTVRPSSTSSRIRPAELEDARPGRARSSARRGSAARGRRAGSGRRRGAGACRASRCFDLVVGAGGEADARRARRRCGRARPRSRAAAWTRRFSRPVRWRWKRGSSMIAPTRASAAARSPGTSWPSTRIVPAVGSARPSSRRISVVLPAPLAPRKPKATPRGTSRSTPSRAARSPKRLPSPRVSMARGVGVHGAKVRAAAPRLVGRQDEPAPLPHPIG